MPNDDQSGTATLEAGVQSITQANGSRTPWTPGQKAKGRKAAKPTSSKRALKLSVDQDTYERLAVESIKSGLNLSELVDKLAREHCNNWVLHAKPGPRG